MQTHHEDLLQAIRSEGQISDANLARLHDILRNFTQSHVVF